MKMSGRELGRKIKAFRATKGLTQSRLAELILGSSKKGRTIGYIEAGEREMKEAELKKLDTVFPEFQDFKPANVRVDEEEWLPVVLQRDFVPQQQEYLRDSKETYEMWFLNGQALPMYSSQALHRTWVENIAAGINYNVMWDLDLLASTDEGELLFRNFIFLAKEIVEHVRAEEEASGRRPVERNCVSKLHENRESGIDVYGYFFGFSSDYAEEHARGRQWYVNALNNKRLKDVVGLRIYAPFPVEAMGRRCCRLPIDAFFIDAATVVYIPNDPYAKGRSTVELEPIGLSRDFYDLATFKAHVFESQETSSKIVRLIEDFGGWYHTKWSVNKYEEWCAEHTEKTKGNTKEAR